MRKNTQDPAYLLKSALSEHLSWHGARLTFLAHFLLALIKVRSVNLAELATGFGGRAKTESHYKRLQRFFRSFELNYDELARLLVRLLPMGDGPWYLTMDRTNWQFGKTDINVLVLAIAYRGIALPVFWSVLDKAGNSNTDERKALVQRFISVFGANKIAALLADREFVGEAWFRWLQAQHIPFHQRIKRDTRIPNAWNQLKRADQLFGALKPGQVLHLSGRRPVWGCFVALSGLRLADGDWLIIASSDATQAQAIDTYARRWEIETLFGCLKSRGFNFEDTHLVDPERLGKLVGLLALAFAWTYRTGEQLDIHQPILFKKRYSDLANPFSVTDSTFSENAY